MLSQMMEYLLHLPRPGGVGFLVGRGATEVIIDPIPPGLTIDLIISPPPGVYARLGFRDTFDPYTVPGSMLMSCSHMGQLLNATRTCASLLRDGWDCSEVVTDAHPCYASVTNISTVNQRFHLNNHFLVIETEDDYKLVEEALDRLSRSARSEQLAQEAVLLLRALVTGEPAPQPSIVGGR